MMQMEFFESYLFNMILTRKIFYLTIKNLHSIGMFHTDIFHVINFIPYKNTVIFQRDKGNEDGNGDENKPEEEKKIAQ